MGHLPLFVVALVVTFLGGCKSDVKVSFDSERARQLVDKQLAFGPRIPGTSPHRACSKWLVEELGEFADEVEVQAFELEFRGRETPFANIVARFRPKLRPRVLLAAHWDSRPIAEKDPDPQRRGDPTPGANDGGSGVAVLLELARMLSAKGLELGVDIVLFDAEDQGNFALGKTEVLLGSQHFARSVSPDVYRYAVLLDMVGEEGLLITREAYSLNCCRPLMDRLWAIAGELGHGAHFSPDKGPPIIDDHVPLQNVGIPAVDLIDLDYPYWHTTADTPDKISAASLGAVGEVVWELLVREAAGPKAAR